MPWADLLQRATEQQYSSQTSSCHLEVHLNDSNDGCLHVANFLYLEIYNSLEKILPNLVAVPLLVAADKYLLVFSYSRLLAATPNQLSSLCTGEIICKERVNCLAYQHLMPQEQLQIKNKGTLLCYYLPPGSTQELFPLAGSKMFLLSRQMKHCLTRVVLVLVSAIFM